MRYCMLLLLVLFVSSGKAIEVPGEEPVFRLTVSIPDVEVSSTLRLFCGENINLMRDTPNLEVPITGPTITQLITYDQIGGAGPIDCVVDITPVDTLNMTASGDTRLPPLDVPLRKTYPGAPVIVEVEISVN